MPDLLRIPSLTHVDEFQEGGTLIIKCEGPGAPPSKCKEACRMTKAGRKHEVRYRDFAVQGQPVWLELLRQKYHCKPCGKAPYEECPELDNRRRVTRRFKKAIALETVNHTFTAASRAPRC